MKKTHWHELSEHTKQCFRTSQGTGTTQCRATTKSGRRCGGWTVRGFFGYCGKHGAMQLKMAKGKVK